MFLLVNGDRGGVFLIFLSKHPLCCCFGLSGRAGHPNTPSGAGQDGEENPSALAENCFRELLGRAAYGNMNNAVRPVLV